LRSFPHAGRAMNSPVHRKRGRRAFHGKEKFKIAPEMIEAGKCELVSFGDWDEAKDAVTRKQLMIVANLNAGQPDAE
jgi:hypothetical protein